MFGLEILETQVDAQTRGVLTEEAAHFACVSRQFSGSYIVHLVT
jgi:hypothetical protein